MIVLVTTPGVALDAYTPLVEALRAEGAEPVVVTFPCSGGAAAAHSHVAEVVAALPEPPVVVAHGIGATLALGADVDVARWVLLGPVLDVVPVAATSWLAERPVGASVRLDAPLEWNGRDLREVLLGDELPPLGCFPGALARDVAGWIRAGDVPLDLESITAPVWIGSGLLDAVAPPEALVPASRRLPDRELVRLGITRMDPEDYDHAALLREPMPIRAAVRAATEAR